MIATSAVNSRSAYSVYRRPPEETVFPDRATSSAQEDTAGEVVDLADRPSSERGEERTDEPGSLWGAYKVTGAQEFRDQLILRYSPLVKFVASRMASGMPRNVELADLVSYGMFGLIDAIEKFDVTRGCKFETYAMHRIRGAIVDELRSMDWAPRSVRAKARTLEKAMAKLEAELHRPPSDFELAAELDMSPAQVRTALSQIAGAGVVSLEELARPTGTDGYRLMDIIADPSDGPTAGYDREERRRWLAKSLAGLSERLRTVLTLYYYEGLSLAQIGQILGVTESRACQIHTQALLQLRSRLAAADRTSN